MLPELNISMQNICCGNVVLRGYRVKRDKVSGQSRFGKGDLKRERKESRSFLLLIINSFYHYRIMDSAT